jgi:hypothetical protein
MKQIYLIMVVALISAACAKPLATGKQYSTEPVKELFKTDTNEAYYAVRWALNTSDYPIEEQDLKEGILVTRFVSTKADSHYVPLFGKKDFGVNGAYYRLRVMIQPSGGNVEVSVLTEVKSLMPNLKSSYYEEERILKKIGDYVRSPNARVTNIGVEE